MFLVHATFTIFPPMKWKSFPLILKLFQFSRDKKVSEKSNNFPLHFLHTHILKKRKYFSIYIFIFSRQWFSFFGKVLFSVIFCEKSKWKTRKLEKWWKVCFWLRCWWLKLLNLSNYLSKSTSRNCFPRESNRWCSIGHFRDLENNSTIDRL